VLGLGQRLGCFGMLVYLGCLCCGLFQRPVQRTKGTVSDNQTHCALFGGEGGAHLASRMDSKKACRFVRLSSISPMEPPSPNRFLYVDKYCVFSRIKSAGTAKLILCAVCVVSSSCVFHLSSAVET
jgi:hypothetical protein